MIIFDVIKKCMMINNNSNTLSIIREIAHRILPNSKVLLFGSRARNDNSNDSDYDFLIITKETIDIRRKRTLKSLLRRELA
ncbi:MAG: nucleotidyltransferase domain-containing protein [Bacteroidota bacterium]